jgi:hypothetical protein
MKNCKFGELIKELYDFKFSVVLVFYSATQIIHVYQAIILIMIYHHVHRKSMLQLFFYNRDF